MSFLKSFKARADRAVASSLISDSNGGRFDLSCGWSIYTYTNEHKQY